MNDYKDKTISEIKKEKFEIENQIADTFSKIAEAEKQLQNKEEMTEEKYNQFIQNKNKLVDNHEELQNFSKELTEELEKKEAKFEELSKDIKSATIQKGDKKVSNYSTINSTTIDKIQDTEAYEEAFYTALAGDKSALMSFGISDPTNALMPTNTLNQINDFLMTGGTVMSLTTLISNATKTTTIPVVTSKTGAKKKSKDNLPGNQNVTMGSITAILDHYNKCVDIEYEQRMLNVSEFRNWISRELADAIADLVDYDILTNVVPDSGEYIGQGVQGIESATAEFVTEITPASTTELTEDEINALISAVKKRAGSNTAFVMDEGVYRSLIRQIKNADNSPVFPLLKQADVQTIEGYPVIFKDGVENIYFGNWKAYKTLYAGRRVINESVMQKNCMNDIVVGVNALISGAVTEYQSFAYINLASDGDGGIGGTETVQASLNTKSKADLVKEAQEKVNSGQLVLDMGKDVSKMSKTELSNLLNK